MATTEKPLRSDARRNRERILEAARELFAERGLGVTLNDIAHHAGVGVGTVYRRFPDKEQLIDDLFEQRVAEIVALAEKSVADPDAWHGLTEFLRGALELQAGDRGVKELMLGYPGSLERVERVRARMMPLAGSLVARAQAEGKLRSDLSPVDVPLVQMLVGTIIDAARDVDPELWRRYLEIVLQGLRAEPAPPQPLAVPPPTHPAMQRIMASMPLARRRPA
jgi:AcrR family transcriptional regulator